MNLGAILVEILILSPRFTKSAAQKCCHCRECRNKRMRIRNVS